jgi:HAD superfamily hydrolase (TIGR01509 family)
MIFMALGALFDVDGTLVDSNYLHVVAWSRAFAACGHRVSMAEIHSLIGQGSGRLVATLLGREDDAIAEAHADFYGPSLYQLRAFDGAAALLRRVKADGFTVVLATSASEGDVEHLRRAIDADDAIDHVTTKDDADASKPAPDILLAALDATGLNAADCVFVGDSVWDVKAANALEMPTVCVLTGGIHEASLREAGAAEIHDSVGTLLEAYETTLISRFRQRAG